MKKIFIVFLCIYIMTGLLSSYIIFSKMSNNILVYYEECYKDSLNLLVEDFKALSKEKIDSADVLSELFKSDETYGFVYKDNIVVYERNSKTTQKYKGSTVRELLNDYSQRTGAYLSDEISDMANNEKGMAIFKKTNIIGHEMIIWKNIDVYNSNYVVGIAAPIKDMFHRSDYFLYMNIFVGNIIAYALIFVVFYVIMKRKTDILDNY